MQLADILVAGLDGPIVFFVSFGSGFHFQKLGD